MTVGELLEILQGLPKDATVFVDDINIESVEEGVGEHCCPVVVIWSQSPRYP